MIRRRALSQARMRALDAGWAADVLAILTPPDPANPVVPAAITAPSVPPPVAIVPTITPPAIAPPAIEPPTYPAPAAVAPTITPPTITPPAYPAPATTAPTITPPPTPPAPGTPPALAAEVNATAQRIRAVERTINERLAVAAQRIAAASAARPSNK